MWKLTNGSICDNCDLFEHECNVDFGDDWGCVEHCECKDANIRERFNDKEVIKECEGFKETK